MDLERGLIGRTLLEGDEGKVHPMCPNRDGVINTLPMSGSSFLSCLSVCTISLKPTIVRFRQWTLNATLPDQLSMTLFDQIWKSVGP